MTIRFASISGGLAARRVGVVDIGSNSIRLVIYDGLTRAPIPILNQKITVGLGANVETTGRLDDVALDFPDLQIIMAHGGRPLWMDEAFFVLRRHRNIVLEISGIPPRKLLDYFPRLAEIGDRVIWGTDWPSPGVRDLRENLEQFLALPIPEDLKTMITRTTPVRLVPPR